MKRLVPGAIAVIVALGGCGGDPQSDLGGRAAALARTVAAEQDHVTVPQLADWLIRDQRDFELIDIRDAAEYAAGHIEGARTIALAALLGEQSLATLPAGRKIVVYSNGTAHAAQAALLLRLVDRDAYALLGGFNHWQAYLHDPDRAGVAEMDPAQRARYQAVACYFAGDYVADSGLVPRGGPSQPAPASADPLGLGLGLGLGSDVVRAPSSDAPASTAPAADPLGLGLDLGLGGEAARSLKKPAPPAGNARKLLIKAEC